MKSNLKMALLVRRVAQYQLAFAWECPETRMSRIVQGRLEPTKAERSRIATELGLSEAELFPSVVNPRPRTRYGPVTDQVTSRAPQPPGEICTRHVGAAQGADGHHGDLSPGVATWDRQQRLPAAATRHDPPLHQQYRGAAVTLAVAQAAVSTPAWPSRGRPNWGWRTT